jgi:tetratricopeptide (TPR) repeat protein
MTARRYAFALVLASCLIQAARTAPAVAAPASSSVKEAGKHFQRGVTLYNEADYRAALVEFRRAYEIAPNAAVLYNLGQTYYQLQNYAQAMLTLERYLAESAGTAPHRADVEQTLETLRTRVGKIKITLNLPDCEITVDDELVGKTPLSEPVVVSIGRRKVTAIHAGRAPETRFIDVAAGDTVAVTLTLADPNAAQPAAGGGSGITKRDLVTPGWIATGVLGAGALASGVYAYVASRGLDDARKTFPADAADLDSKATRVSRFALAADILGVAALVTGAITWKLSRSTASEVRVGFAHNAIQLTGSF